MALTRKFLSALGVEESKADEIIEAHTATVSGLKAEIAQYKEDAEKLAEVTKSLEKTQKELEKIKAETEGVDKDEFKNKYNDLKKEFDDYKAEIKKQEEKATKTKAFKELLKTANISEKRIDAIVRLSDDDINSIEFEKDGSVKNKDDFVKKIANDWSDYVQSTSVEGANTATPPANNGGDGKKISRARQIAQQYHDDLYGKMKEV